jgi:hypothetical protein
MIATSPTSISGSAIQLQLTNDSGGAINRLRIGYDIQRFTSPSAPNELPGFWLFYSLDGGATWTNAAALNPTLGGPAGVVVPNTIGVTNVLPALVTLGATWNPGATLLFRWVDDNAVATSPDQILGLDNVSIQTPIGPAVVLTSPAEGDRFAEPAAIHLEANANDVDGSIAKVEFFAGATKLGEAMSVPYALDWTGVGVGSYNLTAVATDNDGDTATSAPVSVVVDPVYLLSITAAGEGDVHFSTASTSHTCPDDCTASVQNGTVVLLTAAPATGWSFSGWGGACAGMGDCSVLMDADKEVAALFTISTYPLTAAVSGGGGDIAPASTTADYGSDVTFTITPAFGFELQSLTDNGAPVAATPAGGGTLSYTVASVTEPHTIEATFSNAMPAADAGADQTVHAGSLVTLDGSASADPAGRPLSFAWTLTSVPVGSAAALQNAGTPNPTFTADRPGTFTASLAVTNSLGLTSTDPVDIVATNAAPVAAAGGDQTIPVGKTVHLNGGASSDPDGDALRFSWSLTSRPAGSTAQIVGPGTAQPSFVPDRAGTFVVTLIVSDGFAQSTPSTSTVTAISARTDLLNRLRHVIGVVDAMSESQFKKNKKKPFEQSLKSVLKSAEKGSYRKALDELEEDVLPRVDGCARRGTPDHDDWMSCTGQAAVYRDLRACRRILKDLR